jgi:hypothetical protein
MVPRPASASGAPTGRARLPDDLLREASLRLAILAIVVAAIWAAGTALAHLTASAARSAVPATLSWIAGSSVAASLIVVAYARSPHRNACTTLNLGLAYLIFTAFALGPVTHLAAPGIGDSMAPRISRTGALVLIVAAIVPTTKSKNAGRRLRRVLPADRRTGIHRRYNHVGRHAAPARDPGAALPAHGASDSERAPRHRARLPRQTA